MLEDFGAGGEEGETCIFRGSGDGCEELEVGGCGDEFCGAGTGRGFEEAVVVEGHPFGTQHVVETARVGALVFDFEDQTEFPACWGAETVGGGDEEVAVSGLREVAQDDGGVSLRERSHFFAVDGFDAQGVGTGGGSEHEAGWV